LALGPAEAAESGERIVQTARDDVREMTAFLEDAPLPRAVRRLELARDDLTGLIATFRRARVQARRRGRQPDQTEAESAAAADAPGRLGGCVSALRKLRLTARARWRDRLLALRLRNLLGRRGEAILDNVVLVLVVVLAGLILT